MAPLRSRATRNQGDDEGNIVLKGLPIRQWKLTEETIGPPPEVKPEVLNKSRPELPLPKDFYMLPEISQQLLRRARAGHIYHSPTPATNGKDDKSKTGAKEAEGGFVSKKWTLVARDKEAEEPTFLAKRRKGLPPTFGAALANLNPQTNYRTTKVKKYDAEGKLHVYEVLAPEGQQVEGEIVAEDDTAKAAPVEPVAAAPGTVVEGVGVVNEHGVVVSNDLLLPTPPRRKPPPPRRKPKKGPGRGKKKVIFEGGEAPPADGAAASGLLNIPGIAAEQAGTDSAAPSSQADTPMPDAGDDEEGSGSDGEDGDDDGREEGELSPSPEPEVAAGEKTSDPTSDPTTISSAVAEVKQEQKDDEMAVDSELASIEATNPTSSENSAATALPSLSEVLKSPSLMPQPADPSSSSAPELPAQPSSPEIPLATSATSEPSAAQIPELPLALAEAAPVVVEETSAPVPASETIDAVAPAAKLETDSAMKEELDPIRDSQADLDAEETKKEESAAA